MEIPVLIEPVPGSGFRASGGEPFAIVVEGTTRDDALARFKDQVVTKLRNGASLATVEVTAVPHPLAEFAGVFSDDDPFVQEWLEVIREQRNVCDE